MSLRILDPPIGPEVFDELKTAGEGVDWLFNQFVDIGVSITISVDDGAVDFEKPDSTGSKPGADDVFCRLRDVVTRHRRSWLERNLDRYLDARWRADLQDAADAYRDLHVGRGKAPTVKQAFSTLRDPAIAWFGGDLSQLATVLHLDGPVTEPPRRADRALPTDMPALRRRVNELLGGDMYADWGKNAFRRRREQLSREVGTVLALWQERSTAIGASVWSQVPASGGFSRRPRQGV